MMVLEQEQWDQNTLCSKLEIAEGCDVGGDEVGDE
jgi:hypothetical protein